MADNNYLASSSAHPFKVFKPEKKSKVKRKSKSVNSINRDLRDVNFQKYIDKLNTKYAEIEEQVFSQLLSELEKFVFKAKSLYEEDNISSFRHTPCAIVSMSANFNSLAGFTDLLISKIDQITSLKLVVNSDKVKTLTDFVKLVQEKICEYAEFETLDFPFNFYSLTADIFNRYYGGELPVAVIFEDFDCLNQSFLSDLLMLLHENLRKMPVILICCQSSDILSLNMRLPSKATNNLMVETFSCRPTKDAFYKLLNDVCFDEETSFKLGPKIISHLINVYKLWDTSLSGAFRRVKLCLFEHFYNKKYSKLCCSPDEIDSTVSALTDDELDYIRNLPSLESCRLPEEVEMAKSRLKTELNSFLGKLEKSYNKLKLYHSLKELLFPNNGLTFIENTWVPFLENERLSHTQDYFSICDKFTDMDRDSIILFMNELIKCIQYQRNNGSITFSSLQIHFKDFENKVLEDQEETLLNEIKLNDSCSRTRSRNGFSNSPRGKKSSEKILTRTQLKKDLFNMKPTSKAANKITKWKNDFLELLAEDIDKIANPLHLPFHEIFFFNDIENFKELSMPTTRQETLYALENPDKILNCKCCESLSRQSPDISITYSIYCDSLRVANLKNWFDTFKEFVNRQETRVSPRKKPKKETKCDEKGTLLRFISAIGDLEFIGLIRAHPRKIDHVERLVWSLNDHSRREQDLDDQISQVFNSISIKNG